MPLTDSKIVESWNTKQNASSLVLSDLIPFINLIALFTPEDLGQYETKNSEFSRNLINYKLINDLGGTFSDGVTKISSSIKGIPIGSPESQLGTIKQSGGIGINSLSITRGTKESFNIDYDLGMTITEVEEFDKKPELTQLVTLNSNFLLIYGWTGNTDLFVNPPDIWTPSTGPDDGGNVILDMKAGGAYWKAIPVTLFKFEYDFDEKGYINTRIGFHSPHNSTLTFLKVSAIESELTSLLWDDKRSDIKIEGETTTLDAEDYITGRSHEALTTPKGILSIRPVVASKTGISVVYEEKTIKPGEIIEVDDEDDGDDGDDAEDKSESSDPDTPTNTSLPWSVAHTQENRTSSGADLSRPNWHPSSRYSRTRRRRGWRDRTGR